MEYNSATKINEFMKFLAKWVQLENILSKVTQKQPIKQMKNKHIVCTYW